LKIDDHIREKSPDLLVNFNQLYQELSLNMKHYDKQFASIEKKCKKVFESSSLTEDVYKMRDEMKEIKKTLAKFQTTMKKIFD